jgi:hypothetical protein
MQVIREATVGRAMVDHLLRTPPAFADVIHTHFRLRGPAILRTIDRWVAEAREAGDGPGERHANRLAGLKQQFAAALAKIPASGIGP